MPDEEPADHPWTGRIRFSEPHEGPPIAYRHNEVITSGGDAALAVARQLAPDVTVTETLGPFARLVGMPDPIALVRELRSRGFSAQPNHTHFHHALTAGPVYGSPVYGTPVYGTPVYGTPVYGTPVWGTPVYATPVYATHRHGRSQRWSSARPVPDGHVTRAIAERLEPATPDHDIHIVVLDTGLAARHFRPPALTPGTAGPATEEDVDEPDADHDGYLDPAAGHGTFIAGIIAQLAPGCHVTVHRVLSNLGEGQEWDIAKCLHHLVPASDDRTIINISSGGYALEQAHLMEWAIREILGTGAVVVASAGNDATCRPVYPAALHGVLAVGALGAGGPAPFTNYGAWVDVCAPGIDMVSTFFTRFDGRVFPGPDGAYRTDDYRGWAVWSGSSFSAPVVVGNLVRTMLLGAPSAHDAVTRLVHAPGGMSIPNLGRVVNAL